ncbi:RdgB/HAM1 family non-canonical purine NTP pyrophosphatase [Blastopirellula sp. JC732]|uniref:dITP/XTP pyrophosphatase n=1 Tax=Blastopirellula sediminis TaxID=2894196 RepID=A0A9X1MKG0_9BACT|nr:RdgB/HAM1 family non-canonical purine NTP pyrophosphatase [Blastopirellula sediminis]MCC9609647.1 RdgB/HAM1 family non-canonical purine NTP pyrophosphatase [Blastopirellula sediminis]MCC9627577.1 RdgB/HAM1 family non-canonical purine NTP pyrophosphatase [Blastopirellula sediminis]
MAKKRLLVLGTHNKKKGAEMAALLEPLGIELQTLAQTPGAIEVEEDADSFAGNAEKKAVEQAKHLGVWVLAEDSGLCVDALAGEPGIYSARFSGPGATDESNNQLLLEKLAGVTDARRTAHYVCTMRLAAPSGEIMAASEGICRGRIVHEERGSGGFGYDPLFELIEYRRTFGEMGGAVKSVLSHRARASRRLIPQLLQLVISGKWAN